MANQAEKWPQFQEPEKKEKPVEIENFDVAGLAFHFKPEEHEGVLRRLVPDRHERERLTPEEREHRIRKEETLVRLRQAKKLFPDKRG